MKAEKVLKISRKTGGVTGVRWRFWEYDAKRKQNVPVSITQIPQHIRESQDDKIIYEYVNSQNAVTDALKYRTAQRLEWETAHHDFNDLVSRFSKDHQEKAPNSWENDVHWLKSYVLPYFTQYNTGTPEEDRIKNNLNNWPLFFDEFRIWLRQIKPLKVRIENLSLNSQNKVIKALNLFLAWAHRKNLCDAAPKCSVYPKDLLPEVTAADLIEEDEIPILRKHLIEIRPVSEKIFTTMVRTGLRINETLGLCIPFISEGEIEGENSRMIHDQLKKYGLDKYHGYICLENQPALKSIRTEVAFKDRKDKHWPKGSVPRKPLKSRKVIHPKWFRYIPVFDRDAWNVIATAWNEKQELNTSGRFANEQDCLLFEGVTAAMFYADFMEAFKRAKLRPRSPHKARHTFLNWFYKTTRDDEFLSRKVAGHEDKKSREVYSHINEQIGRERKLQVQAKRKMGLVK